MKKHLLLLSLFISCFSFGQDMEDDLLGNLNSNSLTRFINSDKSKLTVTTYRNSKDKGMLEETSTIYRKGKIKLNKINYSIKYTEHFILEDRKKSVGNYQFDSLNNIYRYERSDYNNRNARTATFYNYFTYKSGLIEREYIRVREYVGEGVEQDSVIYIDSVNYKVSRKHDEFRQDNLSYEGAYTIYTFDGSQLISNINYFEGFREEVHYTYDSKNQLVRIENELIGEEEKGIRTYTIIRYSIDGLVTESNFFDGSDALLEKKVFNYK